MKYRLQYHIWSVDAGSVDEAKAKAVRILQNNARDLVSINTGEDKQRPIWKRLLFGR